MKSKILTYNVSLESNLSYAHTFRRLMKSLPDYDWYYGPYGYNGPMRKLDKYTIIPAVIDKGGYPKEIRRTLDVVKPDVLFMHEDMQRIVWTRNVKSVPTILWLPWDNEDLGMAGAFQVAKEADVVVSVAKFAQKLLGEIGIKSHQIYNAVDTNVYKKSEKDRQTFRKILKIPDDHIILTWVGFQISFLIYNK